LLERRRRRRIAEAKCVLATAICVSVCVSVFLSLPAFLHYCMDLDVTLANGKGHPPSCAVFGGFAMDAQVLLP